MSVCLFSKLNTLGRLKGGGTVVTGRKGTGLSHCGMGKRFIGWIGMRKEKGRKESVIGVHVESKTEYSGAHSQYVIGG